MLIGLSKFVKMPTFIIVTILIIIDSSFSTGIFVNPHVRLQEMASNDYMPYTVIAEMALIVSLNN